MALAHLLRTASACLNFTSSVKGNLSYYDLAIARAQYLARPAALPVQTETEMEIKVEDAQSWFVQASRFGARSVVSKPLTAPKILPLGENQHLEMAKTRASR